MRQDLLQLAQTFLVSESVQSADKESKILFLRNKGLNDEEIEHAFKSAKAMTNQQTLNQTIRVTPRPSPITQIVYYPPAPTPRLSDIQIVTYALLFAAGTMGLTVALLATVKKIMLKIIRAIVNYQASRYKQTAALLTRINGYIKAQQIDTRFETEQNKLNDSLDRLLRLSLKIKEDRHTYTDLKSNVKQFTDTILQTSYPVSHSTYVSSANRYQDSNQAAVQNVKSEIRSIKGMLLSRKNFPVAMAPAAAVTPVNLAAMRHSVIPAPVEPSPIYHPRRKRSFRQELAPLVKDTT